MRIIKEERKKTRPKSLTYNGVQLQAATRGFKEETGKRELLAVQGVYL